MKREARCTNCEHIAQYEGKLNHTATCGNCGGIFEMGRDNSRPLWGWRVVRDYMFDKEFDTPEWNRQGKEYGDYQGGKHRYRLRDDDGTTCYIIDADTPPESDLQSRLFAPLDWAMADVGATSIEYRTINAENGEKGWEYL